MRLFAGDEVACMHPDRVLRSAIDSADLTEPLQQQERKPCSPSDFLDFLLPTLDAVEPAAPSARPAPFRAARSLLLELADDPDESALPVRGEGTLIAVRSGAAMLLLGRRQRAPGRWGPPVRLSSRL